MNIKTRNLFLIAIAALGIVAAAAHAQNNPAAEPRPATPPAVERPQVEAPEVEAPDTATNEAANDDNDAANAPANAEDEPPIVWTRDRARGNGRRFRGNGDELVSIGGSSQLEAGRRVDQVVSVFGSSTSNGEVRDAVVSVFGDTRVEGGSVGDSAVAVMGNTYVNAPVDANVVAVMGNVVLGPKADVRGDVVIVGGALTRDPAAQVRGGIQHVMGLPAGILQGLRSWLDNCARYIRPLAFAPGLGWAWTIALGFLGLYALLGAMFREPVDRCVKTLQEHPGQTILASLLTMLLTPVLFMVLAITVIGVVFIPIAGFGMFLATLFGKAVVLAWIGRGILKMIDSDEKLNAALAVLAGGAVVLVLYVVPVLGFLVYNLLGILALGVVVYTLLQMMKARRRNSPPPAFAQRPGGPMGGAPAGPPNSGSAYMGSVPAGAAPTASMSAQAPAAGSATEGGTSGPEVPGGTESQPGPAYATGSAGFTSGAGGAGNGTPPPPGTGYSAAGGVPPIPPVVDAFSAPRAGFWVRMLALLIDAVIIGVALSILSDSHKLQLIALATYGAIMWKMKGTTVGGIVCNLKVVRIDGREIDWSTAIVRALGCFLSLVVFCIGFIWIAFDEGKQGWHDKIAGTAVVRVPQGVSLL
jgi:uncharacterized RDD family membrane protein YckC